MKYYLYVTSDLQILKFEVAEGISITDAAKTAEPVGNHNHFFFVIMDHYKAPGQKEWKMESRIYGPFSTSDEDDAVKFADKHFEKYKHNAWDSLYQGFVAGRNSKKNQS